MKCFIYLNEIDIYLIVVIKRNIYKSLGIPSTKMKITITDLIKKLEQGICVRTDPSPLFPFLDKKGRGLILPRDHLVTRADLEKIAGRFSVVDYGIEEERVGGITTRSDMIIYYKKPERSLKNSQMFDTFIEIIADFRDKVDMFLQTRDPNVLTEIAREAFNTFYENLFDANNERIIKEMLLPFYNGIKSPYPKAAYGGGGGEESESRKRVTTVHDSVYKTIIAYMLMSAYDRQASAEERKKLREYRDQILLGSLIQDISNVDRAKIERILIDNRKQEDIAVNDYARIEAIKGKDHAKIEAIRRKDHSWLAYRAMEKIFGKATYQIARATVRLHEHEEPEWQGRRFLLRFGAVARKTYEYTLNPGWPKGLTPEEVIETRIKEISGKPAAIASIYQAKDKIAK